MTFRDHSRSSETSRFDRAHMISYCRSVVTMILSCIVSHIYSQTLIDSVAVNAVNRVRSTSRFLVTPISLLVGVWLGVLLSWLTVNIGCDWRVLSRRVLWLVKWCLRDFEVSDKYREQRVLGGWYTIILLLETYLKLSLLLDILHC